ncbi:hypothetical protein OC834_007153, partial [Tilletia horrida]
MDDLGHLFSQSSGGTSAFSGAASGSAVFPVSPEKKSRKASPAKHISLRAATAALVLSHMGDLGQLISQSSGGPLAFSGGEPSPAVLPVALEKNSKNASPAKRTHSCAETAAPGLPHLHSLVQAQDTQRTGEPLATPTAHIPLAERINHPAPSPQTADAAQPSPTHVQAQ